MVPCCKVWQRKAGERKNQRSWGIRFLSGLDGTKKFIYISNSRQIRPPPSLRHLCWSHSCKHMNLSFFWRPEAQFSWQRTRGLARLSLVKQGNQNLLFLSGCCSSAEGFWVFHLLLPLRHCVCIKMLHVGWEHLYARHCAYRKAVVPTSMKWQSKMTNDIWKAAKQKTASV